MHFLWLLRALTARRVRGKLVTMLGDIAYKKQLRQVAMKKEKPGINAGSFWWLAMTAMRLLLGAWMLVNGLNHWLPIFPQPTGSDPIKSELLVSLIETGLFGVVKAIEVVGGALLICGRFVPFALVLLMPISAVVFYSDAIISQRWNRIFYMGNDCLYMNVLLLFGYLRHYLPMLAYNAQPGSAADLKQIGAAIRGDVTAQIPPASP
jgi:uncharacterized membrane protein YphA (DoxX/SURF4 family)